MVALDPAPAGGADPEIRVRLLGELEISRHGQVAPITSARARSLIGYLAFHAGESFARRRLAFTLWPDSTESQARTNLRNILHLIRNSVGAVEEWLDVTPATLSWKTAPTCWIDVVAFGAAAAVADLAEPGSDAELDALRTAAGLYTGDLLEDCYDDWVLEERERVRDRVASVDRRLAEVLSARGQHDDALRVARELTRLDPLSEDVYRLRMRVHAAAGDRAGAMRVFHECTTVLRHELGVDPSPATRIEYAELTTADEPSGKDDRPGPSAIGFVGRADELGRLRAWYRDAAPGDRQLVLVTGEAGVGKTRLADELAAWARHRGFTVASARSYPAEGDLGFGVVASWLRNAEILGRIRRAPAGDIAELARILPELGESRRVSAGSVVESDTVRLFDAVARAVSSGEAPVLLILDDAQWSDAPSLQFVHYLVQRAWASPLLVVATVRREDLDPHHPLVSIFGALTVSDLGVEMPLERLGPDETRQLARALHRADLSDAAAEALYADTEGNPLFVVETLRAMSEPGMAAARAPRSPVVTAMTPKLRAVIDARLSRVGDDAQRVLGVAATIGRSFTPGLVAAAAGFDDEALVGGLDELWRRGLVREHGVDAYDFSHGKIRDVAYERLTPAMRRQTHLDVARALIAMHADAPARVAGQIGVNFDRAGVPLEAIDWYERAAREALLRSAYSEAVRFLERAHELAVELPDPAGRQRELPILSMLSTAIAAAGSYASPRQAEIQGRAMWVAAQLNVDLDATMLRSLVLTSLCGNEFEAARTAAERLARSAAELGDQGLAIESEYLLGISAFWAADVRSACSHFESVVERFRHEDRDRHALRFGHDPQIVCASRLANTLWFLGETDAAEAMRERALALAADSTSLFSRDIARVFAAVLAVDLDDPAEVRARAAQLSEGSDRSWVFDVNAEVMNGVVDVIDGRADAGLARATAAIARLGQSSPAPGAISTLTRILLFAHELAGDPAAGLDATERALRLPGTRLWEPEIRRLRAEFMTRLGHPLADVESQLRLAGELADRRGQRGLARRIEASRARLSTAERA